MDTQEVGDSKMERITININVDGRRQYLPSNVTKEIIRDIFKDAMARERLVAVVPAHIISCDGVKEVRSVDDKYSFFASFVVGFFPNNIRCSDIQKLWVGDKLAYEKAEDDSAESGMLLDIRFLSMPKYSSDHVAFNALHLHDFGNRIPRITVEVAQNLGMYK